MPDMNGWQSPKNWLKEWAARIAAARKAAKARAGHDREDGQPPRKDTAR